MISKVTVASIIATGRLRGNELIFSRKTNKYRILFNNFFFLLYTLLLSFSFCSRIYFALTSAMFIVISLKFCYSCFYFSFLAGMKLPQNNQTTLTWPRFSFPFRSIDKIANNKLDLFCLVLAKKIYACFVSFLINFYCLLFYFKLNFFRHVRI